MLQAEVERQRQRLTDENGLLSVEVEKLTNRCEELRSDVRLNEEAMTQLTLQSSLHQNKLAADNAALGNSLDKERVAREKLEAEVGLFDEKLLDGRSNCMREIMGVSAR